MDTPGSGSPCRGGQRCAFRPCVSRTPRPPQTRRDAPVLCVRRHRRVASFPEKSRARIRAGQASGLRPIPRENPQTEVVGTLLAPTLLTRANTGWGDLLHPRPLPGDSAQPEMLSWSPLLRACFLFLQMHRIGVSWCVSDPVTSVGWDVRIKTGPEPPEKSAATADS